MPISQLMLPALLPAAMDRRELLQYWTKPLPMSIISYGPACRCAASIGVNGGVQPVPALSRRVKREPAITCPACGLAGASCWCGAGAGGGWSCACDARGPYQHRHGGRQADKRTGQTFGSCFDSRKRNTSVRVHARRGRRIRC